MPTAGHFDCDVCVMPFEDNAHLQRHLGTNKHVNTLIKKRGGNIDELDMDQIVDITKLTKQELRDYVKNTNRYKELCGEVVDKWNSLWNRIREINKILGHEVVCTREGDGSGDEADDWEKRVKSNLFINGTMELTCEERCSLLEEKEMLVCQNNELTQGSKGDQLAKMTEYAFETTIKELRTEYLGYVKAKDRISERTKKDAERQAEKDKKEAERQQEKDRKDAERQQEKDRKDEARRKKEELTMMILQAKIGMLNK